MFLQHISGNAHTHLFMSTMWSALLSSYSGSYLCSMHMNLQLPIPQLSMVPSDNLSTKDNGRAPNVSACYSEVPL